MACQFGHQNKLYAQIKEKHGKHHQLFNHIFNANVSAHSWIFNLSNVLKPVESKSVTISDIRISLKKYITTTNM